jgi:Secretion system C-terminal sorting domain
MLLKYSIIIVVVCAVSYAQTVYEIVPGSKNNLFELSVANNTGISAQSVSIFIQGKPDWVSFAANEINLKEIGKAEKQTTQFYFGVSEDAPIGEESNVTFRIVGNKGGGLTKVYNIKVTAPEIFEVLQNYPNPFNPSTTIKYSIPQDTFVSIKVFNVLGERVAELVNKDLKTGMHEVTFNASNLSSGFYFYIVEAKGIDGTKYFDSKKMILLK